MTHLPYSDWREEAGLKAVVSALTDGGIAPLAVGGAVRDSLLGLPVSDIDLATALLPNEVMTRLDAAAIKAIPTGIDHGTVTAVAGGRNYEITTFRRDVATDGRRATVAFSLDWREDAQRRDFTINALYAEIASGEIRDDVGGLADLEQRHIRFIGDADKRIAEDHLRILRYFRFLARFGDGKVDAGALAACRNAAGTLKSISRERIASELTRLMMLENPVHSVGLMAENGIFASFLPELDKQAASRLQNLLQREAAHGLAPSLPARLLCLLPPDAKLAETLAARLKLSGRLRKALTARLAVRPVTPQNVREIAYRRELATARDAALLFAKDADLAPSLAMLSDWRPPTFPLKGGELIAMGLPEGPGVARLLMTIEDQWIAEGFPDQDKLREIAATQIARAVC